MVAESAKSHYQTKFLDLLRCPDSCPNPVPTLAGDEGWSRASSFLSNGERKPSFYSLLNIHNIVHIYFIFNFFMSFHNCDLRWLLQHAWEGSWSGIIIWDGFDSHCSLHLHASNWYVLRHHLKWIYPFYYLSEQQVYFLQGTSGKV